MDISLVPQLNKGCRLREVAGERPSLQIPEGMLKMSGAGGEILRLCDGVRTVAEVVEALKARYPEEQHARIEADTMNFLNRLIERSVLTLC